MHCLLLIILSDALESMLVFVWILVQSSFGFYHVFGRCAGSYQNTMILPFKCTSCFGFYHVVIEMGYLLPILEYEIEQILITKLRSMEYNLILALDYAMIRYCSLLSLDFATMIWNYICSGDSYLYLGESSPPFSEKINLPIRKD